MHITRIEIESVRGLSGQAVDVQLATPGADQPPRWVVVAGRNGAGKTTFLRAIAAAVAGPDVGRELAGGFNGWINDHSSVGRVRIHAGYSDVDSFFGSGTKPKGTPCFGIVLQRVDGGSRPQVDTFPDSGWDPSRGPWHPNPRGWFVAGYGPFRRISAAPGESIRRQRDLGTRGSLLSLFDDSASLADSMDWLQRIHTRRMEEDRHSATVPEARPLLEDVVLPLLSDGLLPDGTTASDVTSRGLMIRTSSGHELSLEEMSDGYRSVAALVLDIVRQLHLAYGSIEMEPGTSIVRNEGVVLIDEVDAHLHVSWQQKIGFWLKRHFPNIQFIVTTHSPFICQAADEGGLVRLPAPGENQAARVMHGSEYNRIVNGSVDEAVLSELFGLEHTSSDEAEKLRSDVAMLESKALREALSAEEKHTLASIRARLPQTPSRDVAEVLERLVPGE